MTRKTCFLNKKKRQKAKNRKQTRKFFFRGFFTSVSQIVPKTCTWSSMLAKRFVSAQN